MSPSRPQRSSAAGVRQAKVGLAPADKLKREIQAVLTDELADDRNRTGHGRYDGFAYVAAEAYFHLAGRYAAGLQPMQLSDSGAGSGYQLRLALKSSCTYPQTEIGDVKSW